ncbi:DUF455 family protein [Paenibacillus cymbidii]|uniref:DUF455 family protein n=1 Tax=Paenibacillus cymbidii TaxID=1639034 RepID=UPI001081469E|nr:DUF455 family protein [Paenibacillus cymbidii]
MSDPIDDVLMEELDEVELSGHAEVKRGSALYYEPADTAFALKRLLWHEFELSRMTAGWMPAATVFETKTKLARLSYLHIRDMRMLNERIEELPGGLSAKERTPEPVRELYERAALAPDEASFFAGYELLFGALVKRYEALALHIDPVLDAPTGDILDIVLLKRKELAWIKEQARFAGNGTFAEWKPYVAELRGAIDGGFGELPDAPVWPAVPDAEPAGPVPIAASCDPRFPLYEHAATRKMYADPEASPLTGSVKQMHYINATEISAAENLAYMFYAIQGMPREFYYDLSRHMWDEARHSVMGVRRVKQLGFRTEDFRYYQGGPGHDADESWYADMYASLTMVAEPCSFLKKRKSAVAFRQFGDALSAAHVEFDMADEQMHVNFGKKWGPELFKTFKNDLVTAQEMAKKTRIRRLERFGLGEQEEADVLKNFPAFCGFTTTELQYDKY